MSEIYKNINHTGYIQDVICVTKVVNPIIDKGRSDVKAGTHKQGSLQGFVLDRRNIIFERAHGEDSGTRGAAVVKHRKCKIVEPQRNKSHDLNTAH